MLVYCPKCKRRIFDIVRPGDAEVMAKCHKCGRIAHYALDTPEGRVIEEPPPQQEEACKVIVTEQRALK